jgi:hypothetical protein
MCFIFFLFQLQTREAENDMLQKRWTELVIERPSYSLLCFAEKGVFINVPLCIVSCVCYWWTSTLQIVGKRVKFTQFIFFHPPFLLHYFG